MVASVDEPVGRWVCIDNGSGADAPGVIHLPANLGVSASWNLGIKLTIDAPWWAIVNDDIVFAPGDLAVLAAAMHEQPVIATLDGFSAFAINRPALEAVGWFDENFHPAYVEDCDYEYRARLARVPIIPLAGGLTHERSSTIADARWRKENHRTYPRQNDYFRAKWGGGIRGGETLDTPHGRGGSVADWTLDVGRLAELRWNDGTRSE